MADTKKQAVITLLKSAIELLETTDVEHFEEKEVYRKGYQNGYQQARNKYKPVEKEQPNE